MSHHSSDPAQAAAMSALMRQCFGEYPEGKLNSADEGALALSVGRENGVVKLMFPKPVAWIGFGPQQAVEVAELLIEHARKCAKEKGEPLTVRIV